MAPQRTNNKANGTNLNTVRGSKVQKQRKKPQHRVVVESTGDVEEDRTSVLVRPDHKDRPFFSLRPAII